MDKGRIDISHVASSMHLHFSDWGGGEYTTVHCDRCGYASNWDRDKTRTMSKATGHARKCKGSTCRA